MAKSAAFVVMHLCIAFGVSLVLTGSVTIAGAITLVEALVNTVAHCFFDRWLGASMHDGCLGWHTPKIAAFLHLKSCPAQAGLI